ncbi:hypothetical protein C9374_004639 [Naegleria lovaniensis]|uniref:PIPK domain-containing protein n=1 Tax=Naegleria lovaniensis TaxID=51637 RepID=A0AA88GS29_NAELO|nr:uncharacterized protein C9374_004639 [Naegleria lovaniensis]KAG2383302.1 hypothetical protein C9374_004639 [Naegleria lovaniensis]
MMNTDHERSRRQEESEMESFFILPSTTSLQNSTFNSTNSTFDILFYRTKTVTEVSSYFQLIFASLSFFSCGVTLVVYCGFSELRGRKNFPILVAFIITEGLSFVKHFLILFGYFFGIGYVEHNPTRTDKNLCLAIGIFEYVFNFVSYCFGFCIVLDLLRVVSNPIKGNRNFLIYHFIMLSLALFSLVGVVTESVVKEDSNNSCIILPDNLILGYVIYSINLLMAFIGLIICAYVWTSLRNGLPGTQQLRNGIIIRQILFSIVITISLIGTLVSSVILKSRISDIMSSMDNDKIEDIAIVYFVLFARYMSLLVSSIEGFILSLILLSDPIVLRHLKRFRSFLCMLTENDKGVNLWDRIKKKTTKSTTIRSLYAHMLDGLDDDYELASRRKSQIQKAKDSLYHQRLLFEGIMDEEGSEADRELFLKYLAREDERFFQDSLSNVAIDYLVRRDLIFCVLLGTQYCMKQSAHHDQIVKQFSNLEITSHRNTLYGSPIMKKLFHPSYRSITHKGLFNCVTKHKISITEYYPMAFHHLRAYYWVDNLTGTMNMGDIIEMYKRPFEPTSVILESVRNNFSEGKSGSFFLFTYDSQFIIKTITDEELKLLLENIQFFYKHYTTFRDTLIVKIFGIYELRMTANFKVKFIVVNNALHSRLAKDRGSHYDTLSIDTKFDLKGSWINRTNLPELDHYSQTLKKRTGFKLKISSATSEGIQEISASSQSPNTLLLDNDFHKKRKLVLESKQIYTRLIQQLVIDSNFLKSVNIMDYSLLVGIAEDDPTVFAVEPLPNEIQFYEPFHKVYKGGIEAVDLDTTFNRSVVLFVSIIDILQLFNIEKKVETLFKTKILRKDPYGISSIEPVQYAERFQTNVLSKFTCREDFYLHKLNSNSSVSPLSSSTPSYISSGISIASHDPMGTRNYRTGSEMAFSATPVVSSFASVDRFNHLHSQQQPFMRQEQEEGNSRDDSNEILLTNEYKNIKL